MLPRTQQEDLPSLNMTPLIDMVFLLIIFFLVGTRFYEYENEQKLDLEVPRVSDARPMVHIPRQILIEVSREGEVRIDGRQVTFDRLSEQLKEALKEDPDRAVLIRGDGRAAYQWVAEVLSVCNREGVRHMAVSVRKREAE